MTNNANNGQRSIEIKAISPINIALVKYWGKLDDTLIIPTNSSLSITIDSSDMCSSTVIRLVENKIGISLILNGKESEVTQRIKNVVKKVKNCVLTLIQQNQIDKLDCKYWSKHLLRKNDDIAKLLKW